jgi:PAS domain S-box-containing protein
MRIRKAPWLALLVVALLLIVALLPLFRITPQNRTYIIGWDVDPPDQVATNSGEPTGFAVELVREAAKRRGIRLRWVLHLESSEAALRSKAVDLWPMMVITKDRKQILHLTDPYQENQYGLFVDAKSAFTKTGDLKQRTISYDGMPFNGRLLREHFPGTVHLRKSSLADAVRSVCVGEAEAVFADRIAVFSLLLSNQPCPSMSLRMLPIVTFKTELGIGATRESRAAADAIREEMGVMAGDGSLGKIMSVWSYDSGQELDSLVVLQRAKSQLRWYRIGLAAVAALFLFALWAAAGYRQQRIKAQGYGRALGQAERNVRLVADSLSEMVVAYDMHRSLTYANSGAEKLTGYGFAELQAADPGSWTHPEDRSQVMALWNKVFEGQAVDQVVYRLITKDGIVKWADGTWGLVVDEAGRQVGVRGTCRDITELRPHRRRVTNLMVVS